jgi:hypothetical protein
MPGDRIAGRSSFGKVAVATVLALAAGSGATYWFMSHRVVQMSTPYQAVLLNTGAVYFGRLEGLGTPFPVLRNVFYVQSVDDAQTKRVSNVLVKRGKEWHQPDRMILNSNMIVLVEPVSQESRVAALIAQAN